RVDDAKRAVDLEGVDAGRAIETLREDALEDVAGADVLLGGVDGAEKVFARGAGDEGEGLGDGLVRRFVQCGLEEGLETIEARVGVAVCRCSGNLAERGACAGGDDEV